MFKTDKHARDTKVGLLRGVELFRACSDAELRDLAAAWDEVSFPAGRVLMREGRTGAEAFVLVSGSAQVSIRDRVVTEVGPGAVLGEMALLDREPRAATVTLTADSRLLVIEVRRFHGLLEELPAVAHKILATLSRRLRAVEGKLYV